MHVFKSIKLIEGVYLLCCERFCPGNRGACFMLWRISGGAIDWGEILRLGSRMLFFNTLLAVKGILMLQLVISVCIYLIRLNVRSG
jgi:hypothetical protein